MRLLRTRRSAVITIALLLAGLGAAHALAARGGLSITPGILEATARPGGLGAVKIANTTRHAMRIKLAVRPWVQSRSGSVTPNRRKVLGKVRPNRRTFWLHAGATEALGLSLARRPAGGSLYGAIEVTGAPKHPGGKGIKVAYRLVTSMRLNPPAGAQRFGARAGSLIEHGTTRHGSLFLAVKNTGNTIEPVGGRVDIRGKGHSLSANATAKAIVPGATVNLPLTRLRGTLPRGRYNVTVHLTQGGHGLGKVKRKGVLLR
jgi:hypothetical protein